MSVNSIAHPFYTVGLMLLFITGCSSSVDYEPGADKAGFTQPTPATAKVNHQVIQTLPFKDKTDFDNANKGLIASEKGLSINGKDGKPIWSMPDYDFIKYQGVDGQAPASVNPSLWRQAAINNIHGLFKVTDGIYQLRGFDLSNMTIIEGKTGWIIVDVLTAAETSKAALLFAQKHLGKKPITAILFTHSHIDHFGGIDGVMALLSDKEKKALRIIAPKGFMEEATSENIIAGTAMGRRAMYMYGKRLPRSVRGHVGSGLGKGPAFGTHGIITPTELIDKTPQTVEIDGIPFIFQYTPGSEAPAEFTFYLPTLNAFCGAEVVSQNMHNLYTLRGAKVRDALSWSAYIEQARTLFGNANVYFASHHWPLWGRSTIQSFLIKQRDTYKYIHDQSVRMINAGFTPNEIADQLKMPESLRTSFSNRGYYGTVKHNAKAVYQAYMGWFTGNPSQLDPLPEVDTAKRTIAMMGGVDAVLQKAQKQFDALVNASADTVIKEYRWIAQLLNQAVFAEPDNKKVKALLAKTYDQLGYLAESGPWRDFYLTGAYELRHGGPDVGMSPATMKSILMHTPVDRLFDTLAVTLNGPNAEGKRLKIKINFTDLKQAYLLDLENSVIHHKPANKDTQADAILNITHSLFVDLLVGNVGIADLITSDDISTEGSSFDLIGFFSLLDKPEGVFGIVMP